jgi:hypothetical protein
MDELETTATNESEEADEELDLPDLEDAPAVDPIEVDSHSDEDDEPGDDERLQR